MICKHCGKETSNVFCDNCGINAVWYNKYGYIYDDSEHTTEIDKHLDIMQSDFETELQDIFQPDGSGD